MANLLTFVGKISDQLLLWLGVGLQYLFLFLIYFFLYRLLRLLTKEFYQKKQTSVAPVYGKLIVESAGNIELTQPTYEILATPFCIGRNEQNQLILEDAYVSFEHAVIEQVGKDYVLKDLQSRNGTYLNGKLVEGKAILHSGDHLSIGSAVFRYER